MVCGCSAESQTGTTAKMYWTDFGTNKIQQGNTDGSGVKDLIDGLGAPIDIKLEKISGRMYWVDAITDKIQCANMDGSGDV
jgi:hypothetical protein